MTQFESKGKKGDKIKSKKVSFCVVAFVECLISAMREVDMEGSRNNNLPKVLYLIEPG